jgi:hypothetical protein
MDIVENLISFFMFEKLKDGSILDIGILNNLIVVDNLSYEKRYLVDNTKVVSFNI